MCPECQEPLVAFELEGVEIDHCVSCGGTWLDAGEIEMISELAGSASGGFTKALDEAGERRKGRRRCPRCRRKLTIVGIGEEDRLELDHCPRGHGLWFDKGEMKAAIESLHDLAE